MCRGSSTHATVGILPEPLGWPWQFSRVGFTFQLELEVNSMGAWERYRYTSYLPTSQLLALVFTIAIHSVAWYFWLLFVDCPCSKPVILVSHIPMFFFGMLSVASDKPAFFSWENKSNGIFCKNKHQVQHHNSAVVDRGFTNFCEISIAVNTSCMTSYQWDDQYQLSQHLVSNSNTFLRRSKGSRWRSLHGWWKKSG